MLLPKEEEAEEDADTESAGDGHADFDNDEHQDTVGRDDVPDDEHDGRDALGMTRVTFMMLAAGCCSVVSRC